MTVALASISLVVALVALALVRRQARKLEQLTGMYWQLRYDHGELKATVAPSTADGPPPISGFVPLGSLKRTRP
jgi:methionine salvage enolase-phosphatase E1